MKKQLIYTVFVLFMRCEISIIKNLLKCLVKLSWFEQESKIEDLQTKTGALESKIDALESKLGSNDCKHQAPRILSYIIYHNFYTVSVCGSNYTTFALEVLSVFSYASSLNRRQVKRVPLAQFDEFSTVLHRTLYMKLFSNWKDIYLLYIYLWKTVTQGLQKNNHYKKCNFKSTSQYLTMLLVD